MNEGTKRRVRYAAAAVACVRSLAQAGLHAQETADAASAVLEAALPAELAKVAREPVSQQARWLRTAAQPGTLAQLDDATLTALFKALDPLAVPLYIRNGPNGYPSYQFTMVRQERIGGKWSDTPDHKLVKTTREPLRV